MPAREQLDSESKVIKEVSEESKSEVVTDFKDSHLRESDIRDTQIN